MEPSIQPAQPPEATIVPAPLPPKKRSLLWLWISLGALVLIIGGLVAGFLVVKSAADSAAQTYTAQVKSYLDEVYDSATSAASDPNELKKAVGKIDAPVLEPAVLEMASSDYAAAKILKIDVATEVNALMDTLGRYATVYEFYTDYLKLSEELTTISDKGVDAAATGSRTLVASYLSSFRDTLDEIVTLADDSKLPNGLDKNTKIMSGVFSEMSTNWGQLVSAFNNNNRVAYSAAYNSYLISSAKVGAASSPLTTYYNNLSSKTRAAAGELRSYQSTIR